MRRQTGFPGFFRIAVMVVVAAALGFFGGSRTMAAQIAPDGGTTALRVPGKLKARKAALAVADTGNNRVLIYTAPLRTDERATLVLGQPNFVQGNYHPGTSATASTFTHPLGLAKDRSGNLYVVDSWDCRVLQFRPPFSNDMSASLEFGQPELGQVTQGCTFTAVTPATPTNMNFPSATAVDDGGNVWVADTLNSRVLEYVRPFSNGEATALVIGQTTATAAIVDFFDYGCNHDYSTPLPPNTFPPPGVPSATTLCSPDGIAFDSQGNLWVADRDNNRVTEYTPPFSTGMAASLELGQPAQTAFTSIVANNGGISAATLNSSRGGLAFDSAGGLAFDSKGDLWVSDLNNSRVLEFEPPFSNGMAATTVLGQADFFSGDPNQGSASPNASSLAYPEELSFDSEGNLVVADQGNNRVLIFEPPFSNGINAKVVLGQPNFTQGLLNQFSGSYGSTPNAFTLASPVGVLTF